MEYLAGPFNDVERVAGRRCNGAVTANLPASIKDIISSYKPDSITLASSALAPNMFGASSELVRS